MTVKESHMKKQQTANGARRRGARIAAIGVLHKLGPDCVRGRAVAARARSI